MSDPTTKNRIASVVNQILKQLIEGTDEDAIEAALIVEYPFLGLPFIKQLFEFILSKVATFFYEQAAHVATTIVVDIQTNQEASSVKDAFENLQMAIASGDKNATDRASKDLSNAYGDLIHFDGAAPP